MELSFLNLKDNTNLYHVVEKTFKEIIEPLYGNQKNAIKKLTDCTDRNCEILFINNQPEGLIVYKTSLQTEFCLENAFELKTALLLTPENGGRNLGRYLFQRAENLACEHNARYIYGTISKQVPRVLHYLKKIGWLELKQTESNDNLIDVIVVYKELKRNDISCG